jgi:solute carrier family 35 protein E1
MRVIFPLAILLLVLTSIDCKTTRTSSITKTSKSLRKFDEVAVDEISQPKLNGVSLVAALPVISPAMKLVGLFTAWYGFNAAYNVFNAFVKKDFPYPWTISCLQLIIGLFYSVPLWFLGIRKWPKINFDDLMKLLPIAMLNAGGHALTVNAMFERGGGSFTHVIKASEPVVSVILSFLVNGLVPKPLSALSLLPVTYGVAYASTLGNMNVQTMSKELTTKAAKMAMASNVAFSMRSIVRKNLPSDFKSRTNLDATNEFAVTTALSVLLVLPFILCFESIPDMSSTFSAMANQSGFITNLLVCGMSFYLYNELQNVVLGALGPVPTAVGNTLKRVVIFVALYYFTAGETFPVPKIVGCAIAIAGCLSYAVCDSKKI